MYECTVTKEYAGKILLDFILHMGREKEFEWDSNSLFVSLDDKLIAQGNIQKTLVREGQIVKVFSLPAGG